MEALSIEFQAGQTVHWPKNHNFTFDQSDASEINSVKQLILYLNRFSANFPFGQFRFRLIWFLPNIAFGQCGFLANGSIPAFYGLSPHWIYNVGEQFPKHNLYDNSICLCAIVHIILTRE